MESFIFFHIRIGYISTKPWAIYLFRPFFPQKYLIPKDFSAPPRTHSNGGPWNGLDPRTTYVARPPLTYKKNIATTPHLTVVKKVCSGQTLPPYTPYYQILM